MALEAEYNSVRAAFWKGKAGCWFGFCVLVVLFAF